jgi:hypothetical protein
MPPVVLDGAVSQFKRTRPGETHHPISINSGCDSHQIGMRTLKMKGTIAGLHNRHKTKSAFFYE